MMAGLCAAIALLSLPAQGLAAPPAGPFEQGIAAYDRGDFAGALAAWLPLAQAGHVSAEFNVATLYEKGIGTPKDPAAAAHWYLEAAKHGEPDAMLKVASLYEQGEGVDRSEDEARRWYEALLQSPAQGKAAYAAKSQARTRLAALSGATEQTVAYDKGRYVLVKGADGVCIIGLQGVITPDATDKFDEVVTRSRGNGCQAPWLMLESPGGLVEAGLRLGEAIHAQGFRTITRYECASMCGLIFLAGTERVLVGARARIGLHQVGFKNREGEIAGCERGNFESDMRAIRNYLHQVVPARAEPIVEAIHDTSCHSIRWVKGQEALDMGIATRVVDSDADLFGPRGAGK